MEDKNTTATTVANENVSDNETLLDFDCTIVQNSLKIMDGKYGGGFFIKYIFDTGSGCGWLQLIIQYPTGTIQTRLLCKNVCKLSSYDEDGLGEVEGISYVKFSSGEHVVYKPYLNDSQREGVYDIMRECERQDMPIPLYILWQRLVENYPKIPIEELVVKKSLAEVYERLIEKGEARIQKDVRFLSKNNILLTRDDVMSVAEECGYSFNELRTEFACRGLWDYDKRSGGYQKTRKVNGTNKRFYALKMRINDSDVKDNIVVDNVEYSERSTPTKESAEIEKLKGELVEQRIKASRMAQIVCKRLPDLTQEEIIKELL